MNDPTPREPLPLSDAAPVPGGSGWRPVALILAAALLAGCARDVGTELGGLARLVGLEIPAVISLRVVYVACGAVLLLMGWRLHRFLVALPGFAVGGSLGALATSYASDNPVVIVLAVVILGGLGAWLALTVFRLAVFVSGALAGIVLADTLWPLLADAPPPFWGILAGAAVGGLALLALVGVWMPVVSSAIGAALIGAGLDLGLLEMLALFALGVLVQFGVARSVGENAFARRVPER